MASNSYGKKSKEKASNEPLENDAIKKADVKQTTKNNENQPRQMTFKRKLTHALLKPVLIFTANFIWLSCRVKVIGAQNMDDVINKQKPVILCYWHQQLLFCTQYMLQQIKRGMNAAFLISPSVDGEVPAQIVASRGARVIRGSSTRTGAQALRYMYQIIAKESVSPIIISDGPTGPIFKFKPGAAMLSQMTKVPMLPIACAAKNAWYMDSWDRFMIPKPFTLVVVAVGEPVLVEKTEKGLSAVQTQMEEAINALMIQAKQAL